MKHITLEEAQSLPRWRRPETLLFVMAIAMPLAFSTWLALLENFIIERAGFNGSHNGWLHSVREVPGFLAFSVIFILAFVREQSLALISLGLLGIATAATAFFPDVGWILFITFFSSIGFHFYETVNQSLQLQWLSKESAPQKLAWMVSVGSGASLFAYGLVWLTWGRLGLGFNGYYMMGGGLCAVIALACWFLYPRFEAPTPQRRELVLRKRYWLYYALQFMAGARRQIFVVFAAFMMVEKFNLGVEDKTGLLMITLLTNMFVAPVLGQIVKRFGERNTLVIEYIGLICVFLAYGGLFWFGWGVLIACALYVIDHIFFALAFALKTYFQKIADPADIAPTAAVAFTINHIAAVFLPAALGYLWLVSPDAVFIMAACMAGVSLALALLIPRHPRPGRETILSRPVSTLAE